MHADDHVLDQRHLFKNTNILKSAAQPEPRYLVRLYSDQALAAELDRATTWRQQPRNQIEYRRFTRAIGTDQAEDLPLRHLEGHVL